MKSQNVIRSMLKGLMFQACLLTSFGICLPAQSQTSDAKVVPATASKKSARASFSPAGKAALAAAKAMQATARGLRGAERLQVLERVGSAYDKVVVDFAAEPLVAGAAAFAAAEVWRQQGSLPLAEKDYLLAAKLDAERLAQRGVIGAADMQRRQKRFEDALATYARAAAIDASTGLAHDARLWQARILQSTGKVDAAITAYQSTLESARPGRDTIDTANFLALAWIEKGDLTAAGHVIDHADEAVAAIGEEDPVAQERLRKALASMSARKALQRAQDKQSGAVKDAIELEGERARNGGGGL